MTPINMDSFYAAAAAIKEIIADFIAALQFLIDGFKSKAPIDDEEFSF